MGSKPIRITISGPHEQVNDVDELRVQNYFAEEGAGLQAAADVKEYIDSVSESGDKVIVYVGIVRG